MDGLQTVARQHVAPPSPLPADELSPVQALGTRPPGLPLDLRHTREWEELRRAIHGRAMKFNGHLSFDFRELLTEARHARMAGLLMWQMIKPLSPAVLVGPGFGATPLLYAIAHAALEEGVELQVLMVRDRRKEHNQKRWVEGHRAGAEGKMAVIVDDFMLAGSSVPLVKQALEDDKVALQIAAIALFFDMWEPLGSRQLSASGWTVMSLFTRHDVGLSRDAADAKPPLMKGNFPAFIGEPLWWRFDLNTKTGYELRSAPVIADDAIFVADDKSRLWRHDALTGDIEWRYDSLSQPLKGIVQLLQFAEDSVIFGCYDGTVSRVDAKTGCLMWRWRQDSSVHATPELDLVNRRLFINTEQWNHGAPFGHLQCLDFDTGRMLWTHRQPYWPPGSPVYQAALGAVIAPCNDSTLLCTDASTGELRWRRPTRGLVRGKPGASTDGVVVVATESGWLQCLEVASGDLLWEVRCGKGAKHQFLRVDGDRVFVFDGKWHFSCFDLASGTLRWLTRLRSPGNWCPVEVGRYLVVGSKEGHLAVLDPRAQIKVWEGQIRGHVRQPPAIGRAKGRTLMAIATNEDGLKTFEVNPYYDGVS